MTTVGPGRADGRAVAGFHPGRLDLLDRRGPQAAGRRGRVDELGLVDLVIAPDDGRDEPAVTGHEEGGLGRPVRTDAQERRQRGDGRRAGRLDLLERQRVLGGRDLARDDRDLAVRRVVARLAQHEDVLAGRVEHHEFVGLAAAHHPDVGRDGDGVEPEPLEDPDIRAVLGPVADVEAGLVAVAAVGVLHDELADADEAAAGSGLVAPLRLEVIDHHRELAVRLHDVGEQERDDLLVGHREDHVAAVAVLEAAHLGPDGVVATAESRQTSAGWTTGISISCEPIRSISSRMICSTRLLTRNPSGSSE